jgi:DNA-binding NtrC family response regulator
MNAASHRRRVLVVEDDRTTQHLLAQTLGRIGVDPVMCETIAEGLAVLESGSIDAVILDVVLPDGNGLKIIGHIRALQQHLPVIVISRVSDFRTKIDALRLGADAYVAKPVDWDVLSRKVELLLAAGDDAARILIVEDDPISAMVCGGCSRPSAIAWSSAGTRWRSSRSCSRSGRIWSCST